MDKLKWGLVGLGHVTRKHLGVISRRGDCELRAVCDVSADRVKSVSGERDVAGYTDPASMVRGERLDVVSVCTPHHTHFKLAKQLLEAGVNVLMEKPPCMTTDEVHELMSVEKRTGKNVYGVLQYRYNPTVRRLRSILQQGLVGRPIVSRFHINWYRGPEYYLESDWRGDRLKEGGVLFNQFFHHLDLITYLFGRPAESRVLTSKAVYGFIDTEDTVGLLFKFDGGHIVSLTGSVVACPGACLESLEIFSSGAHIKLHGPRLTQAEAQSLRPDADASALVSGASAPSPCGAGVDEVLYDALVGDVVESLKGGRRRFVALEDVVSTVGMIQNIYAQCYD